MIKKSFLRVSISMTFIWFMIGQGYAANFNVATASSPAQILIQNALITTSSGDKHASIQLIAKDNKNLHEGQIYQAYFGVTNPATRQDANYSELDETIYIQELLQAGSLLHQITLRCINRNSLEFAIVEMKTSVVKPAEDLFFDSTSVHRVNY